MTDKATPEGPAGGPTIEAALRSAAAGDTGEADDPFAVRMTVGGGIAGERFAFDFEADRDGNVRCGLHCDLSERDHPSATYRAEPEAWRSVLDSFRVPALAATAHLVPIPPDSLVGRLEIQAGPDSIVALFMADEGQARDAGFRSPPDVLAAADALYDLAARQMGIESARP